MKYNAHIYCKACVLMESQCIKEKLHNVISVRKYLNITLRFLVKLHSSKIVLFHFFSL